jgi:hypothetical protein
MIYFLCSIFKNHDIKSNETFLLNDDIFKDFESSSTRVEIKLEDFESENKNNVQRQDKSKIMCFPYGSGILKFGKKYILHLDISLTNSLDVLVFFFFLFYYFSLVYDVV